MSQPLFKVGEQVGLVSKSDPSQNGEHVVREVLYEGDPYRCRITLERYIVRSKGYSYILEDSCVPDGKHGEERPWAESALRKLHKPSKYSFEQLLSEIKQRNMNTIGD